MKFVLYKSKSNVKIVFFLRYGIKVKLDGSEKEIENAILQHSPEFKRVFRVTWGAHKCDVAGCGTWLICDGGMKPHRIVCAARYSGIRSYKHTNIRTVTGCTRKPAKDQKFCPDHKGQEGPVVLAENLSAETKRALRKKQTSNYPQDNIFFVRALLKQEGERYLVRWATHHVDEATWEQQSSLPAFIVDWYVEDPSRLGTDIPQPSIKWSKVCKVIILLLLL